MKTFLLLGTLLVGAAGCGEKTADSAAQTNSTSSGGSVVTAPVDYLGAISKGQQSAIKTVDTTALSQAVDLFQVDQGRYPKDLNELVQKKYLPRIPDAPYGKKIVYDAATGKVDIVNQ